MHAHQNGVDAISLASSGSKLQQVIECNHDVDLSSYPVNMSLFLTLQGHTLDSVGVPCQANPPGYHPTTITQYALAYWNQYLATNDEKHRSIFLTQARWLVEHEVSIVEGVGGWPISFPHPEFHTRGSWLSALTQGYAISVLTRAFQLTQDETFLAVAHRAVRTFELDILDGGVCAPICGDGVFFQEAAVYPAAHKLSGFIFALFGLYDYVALTHDHVIEKQIDHSLRTMHSLLTEFDAGFWTRSDLLHRHLASPAELTLQITLLDALASYSKCQHCSALASHWREYQHRLLSRLRYQLAHHGSALGHALLQCIRSTLFPTVQPSSLLRVCVPLPDFPFTGGVLTVLQSIAQVTSDAWRIEYMARNVGPNPNKLVIHRFGTAKLTPWHFPVVWLYVIAGLQKLISLMRHGVGYDLILPQDGVFTAAFAALVAKLAGVRVVCIDHSILTWTRPHLHQRIYAHWLATRQWSWFVRRLLWLFLIPYRPSLSLLAHISVRLVDHFLIPGVPGDEMEEVCHQLKVPQSRITRFASMIDIAQHTILDPPSRAKTRQQKGIPADAIVVAIVCRLSPEKGLEIAMESIHQALASLSAEKRKQVRIIIAGDGPLRRQLEEDIHSYGLSQLCCIWGNISAQDVFSLLAISDIFLYTSTHGACIPMSVLEAMASGCAVIATTQPLANAVLLTEERGIVIPPNDTAQARKALERLLNDPELCCRMGKLARDYITEHHNAVQFRRTLLRVASCCS